MRIIFYITILTSVLFVSCKQAEEVKEVSVIPQPTSLNYSNGEFEFSKETQLITDHTEDFENEIAFFQTVAKASVGSSLSATEGQSKIYLIKSDEITVPESYSIQINSNEIKLIAGDQKGIFYAIETLRQIISTSAITKSTEETILLPQLRIQDQPKYSWRGMHLDVSRHFFSIDFLKKYVDVLAYYKINKLHLHLTDDQGWRLEIKKYPLLTEQGAWRTFNAQDSVCMKMAKEDPLYAIDTTHIIQKNGKTLYGGFYTQDQMKAFVKYASKRHVEIIPEIDMPGHMMAAINIYPNLSATGKSSWGKLFSTPLSPVKEEVYTFIENILDEVIQVFSSDYVHIGADEVEKSSWMESAQCQAFMKKNGFTTDKQLQGYFVNRVADYLKSKNKKVIVWDDALEDDIDSTLNVMYWRNWIGGVPEKVAANGNQMIMVPGDPLYFSRMSTPLYNIYNMNLLGDKYPADKMNLIKGIQACVWSERVGSYKVVEALVFPKLLALSERAWSSDQVLDWEDFKVKVKNHIPILDNMNVNYHYKPTKELTPIMEVDTLNNRIGLSFISELSNPTIYYTTDGTVPTNESKLYKGKFYIEGNAKICAAVFTNNQPEQPYLEKELDYHLAIGKAVSYNTPWNKAYPAADTGSLTDGYRGGKSYGDGKWQGFTTDLDVVIDLGEVKPINSVTANFMQITGPGVYMPESFEVSISTDGKTYMSIGKDINDVSKDEKELTFKKFTCKADAVEARFLRVVAKNKQQAFIFTDEIVVN
ncbi:glycoside hydrolase family 20 protein [Plebeiibacterium sediminum]|uniref:beta-N-acetylhexosaminidase n=1 Tax=Plebeiibacterium sediminum TaxID=2992112 RepID=A0AAE3M109_9BACT|nr:family 20 glycosylhydrolase [Plebeiobacterium sediminum]MCW3785291.1 glycoside hydrolase family 20 protein [Plebeiobacterium sediminum]